MAITAETRTDIVQLVVSMLGRAPSTAELTDLVTKANSGSTMQELADSLASEASFTASYPVWLTAKEFTAKIVANTFAGGSVAQADVDAAVDYIAGAITAGTFSKTSAVVALTDYLASADGIANATYGSAAQSYQNKVAVAEYYSITKNLGGNSVADLTAAIAGVTSDAATVTAEKASVDSAEEAAAAAAIEAAKPKPGVFNLTTKLDTASEFTGGATDDSFNGLLTYNAKLLTAAATVTAGDTLVGGAGTDTLEITVTGAALPDVGDTVVPTLTGIENVWVRSFETNASGNTDASTNIAEDSVVIDLSNATGVTHVGTTATNNVEADVSFTSVTGIPLVTMSGKGDLAVTVASGAAGLADSATLNLNDVGTKAGAAASANMSDFDMQNIETLTINSGGGSNFLGLADGEYTTINVTGDQALTLDVVDAEVTAFDASALTGKLTVDLSDLTLASVTSAKGGSGTSDTLTLGGGALAASPLSNPLSKFSGFEKLGMNTAHNITLSTPATGFSDFDLGLGATQVLALNDGYTGDTTVTAYDAADAFSNAANVALTVSGPLNVLTAGTMTGGTGTDIYNGLLGGAQRTVVATFTKFETINILPGLVPTSTGGITLNNANVAAGKTLTINGGLVSNTSAVQTINGAAELDGVLVITGGAANDILTGGAQGDTIDGGLGNDTINGGAGSDTLTGGAGNDIITMGTGADIVVGGDGKDVIVAGANLAATDSVDGGDGADTLRVTALSAAALAGVKNVETLQLTGGATASVTANLAFDTIDLDQGPLTNTTETLTLGKGYTNVTTVKVDAGDTVTNTAADAVITITGDAASFDAADNTIITGSDKAGVTNSLIVMNGDIAGNVTATVDFANDITNIDAITVLDWPALNGNDINLDLTSYGTALTIDASALDTGEKVVIQGASAKAINYTGGQGGDTVVLSAGNDTIVLGNAKNTITGGANLTYQDTITGGSSTDTLSATGVTDIAFQNVTGVEVLAAAGGATLGTFADAAGIRSIAHDATNAVAVTTMTSDITITASAAQTDTWTGGLGNDTFAFTSTGTLVAADTLSGGGGTANVLQISNDDDDAGTVGEATTATIDAVSKIQTVKIKDTATDNAIGDVTLIVTNIAYDQTSVTVDAADLDAGEDFSFDASAITQLDEAFLVTAGSGSDTLISGNGKDTLVGGAGADTLDGNAGADTLTGGSGADNFNYTAALTNTDSTSVTTDTITDFTTASDDIVVALSTAAGTGLTASVTDKGDAASLSAGLSLLSGKKGEYFFAKDTSQFAMDLDGNGLIQSSDLIINMTGLTGFDDADLDMTITAATTSGQNSSITTGDGNDIVIYSGTGGLEATDVLDLDGGTNQVQLDFTGAVTAAIDMDNMDGVLSFVTTGTDGGNAAATALGLTFSAITETTAQTVVFSAASITDDDDDVTITNSSARATTLFNLTGGAGDDTLVGGSGADVLVGGSGADILVGGLLGDTLTGGAGADVYRFAEGDSPNTAITTVTDYATTEQIDGSSANAIRNANAATEASGTAGLGTAGALATFNAADNTLALRITAVEAALATTATARGESGHFMFGSDTYIFISDAAAGVTANDIIVKLEGVDATTAAFDVLTIASNNVTLA